MKSDNKSEVHIEKSFKPPNTDESDKLLKERILLFLENKKRRINRNKFVKFSSYEFFLHFIPCNKLKSKSLIEKEILISKTEEKIAEYLDVCSYTKTIENLEKLKLLLLNNYQKLSFEYFKNRNTSDLLRENYDDKILESIKYFKRKIKESNLDNYDIKLLDNFSKEYAELILK